MAERRRSVEIRDAEPFEGSDCYGCEPVFRDDLSTVRPEGLMIAFFTRPDGDGRLREDVPGAQAGAEGRAR